MVAVQSTSEPPHQAQRPFLDFSTTWTFRDSATVALGVSLFAGFVSNFGASVSPVFHFRLLHFGFAHRVGIVGLNHTCRQTSHWQSYAFISLIMVLQYHTVGLRGPE